MARRKVTDIAAELLQPFLSENGYELYASEFVKEGSDWFLRIYADKTGGEDDYMGTDDCEKISRYLSEKLDEEDPIEQNYYLEVSSPGLDRPLVRPEHYERYLGHEINVKLYRGIDGSKELSGILESFDGESLVLAEESGKKHQLNLTDIAKANLAVIL